MSAKINKDYWDTRYQENQTGWDLGAISTPLKEYIDQLTDKSINILVPGGGNSYEAEYLFNQGFTQVYVVDISKQPLDNLQKRIPAFPAEQLLHQDFFTLEDSFDLIIEQTFFCALSPTLREKYVEKMHQLLAPKGKLVGLLFDAPLNTEHPPFGGNKAEYIELFQDKFEFHTLEKAHNSIEPRAGKELFINFRKK